MSVDEAGALGSPLHVRPAPITCCTGGATKATALGTAKDNSSSWCALLAFILTHEVFVPDSLLHGIESIRGKKSNPRHKPWVAFYLQFDRGMATTASAKWDGVIAHNGRQGSLSASSCANH